MTLTTKAYAKINLFLKITGRRDDGYHELESIMQSVSLADIVSVTKNVSRGEKEITIVSSDKKLPSDRGNIAYRAAEEFFEYFGIPDYSVTIELEKHIPSSAGLGGGSSDGAATISLLNKLYETGASLDVLAKIGAKVGADIPFCIYGGTCLCRGIGDIVTPIDNAKPQYEIIIARGGEGVSTPYAYSLYDDFPQDRMLHLPDGILYALENGLLPDDLYNGFERPIYSVREKAYQAKQIFESCEIYSSLLSGSGPSVFALSTDTDKLSRAENLLSGEGFEVYRCTPVYNSDSCGDV